MIEHEFAASVVRVIFAGNSLYPSAKLPEGTSLKSITSVLKSSHSLTYIYLVYDTSTTRENVSTS